MTITTSGLRRQSFAAMRADTFARRQAIRGFVAVMRNTVNPEDPWHVACQRAVQGRESITPSVVYLLAVGVHRGDAR